MINPEVQPLFQRAATSAAARRTAYGLMVLQLVALCALAYRFELEPGLHLAPLLALLTGGFILHSGLPERWRTPFFLLLSLAGLALFTSIPHALMTGLAGAGILLAARGVPGPWWRYLILAMPLLGLIGLVFWQPTWMAPHFIVLSTLGSMFMFRLSIFLYDRHTQKDRRPFTEDLTYFFMIPNMALLLFPAVDYSTFQRKRYDSEALLIYKKGVQWLTLGLFHLVVYRFFYFYLHKPVTEVRDLLGFAQYALVNYLLIVRLSGIFHTAVGALCLFGYNLHPVFNQYFLASGFSDLWRRINIYFREYLVKVFYYPLYFRIRHWGNATAVVVTILVLFGLTWLLHSFQWFWLKGKFPLRDVDAVFWGLFGLLVAANALLEMRRGRQSGRLHPLGTAMTMSARILGMLTFMSILWSLWSAPSLRDWMVPVRVALSSPVAQWAQLLGILVIAWTLATALYRASLRFPISDFLFPQPQTRRATGWALTMLFGLSLIQPGPASQWLSQTTGWDLSGLQTARLQEADERKRIEGYYSDILVGNDLTDPLADWTAKAPEKFTASDAKIFTEDFRHIAKRPNVHFIFKGQPFTVNRWGMRDKDYERTPPAGTIRVMLMGGSFVVGSGVADEDIFDRHLEDSLNQLADHPPYELLNFSTASYDLIDCIIQMEVEELQDFKADYLFFFSHGIDGSKSIRDMARNAMAGRPAPYPYLEDIQQRAGIRQGMTEEEMALLLEPFTMEILEKSYQYLYDLCQSYDIRPYWIYWPPIAMRDDALKEKEPVMAMVRRMGYEMIDLAGIYDGYKQRELTVSVFDMHPNPLGHQLVAEALFRELREKPLVLRR